MRENGILVFGSKCFGGKVGRFTGRRAYDGGLHTLDPTPNIRAVEPVAGVSSRAIGGIGPGVI